MEKILLKFWVNKDLVFKIIVNFYHGTKITKESRRTFHKKRKDITYIHSLSRGFGTSIHLTKEFYKR
jgi:hypothetical protein